MKKMTHKSSKDITLKIDYIDQLGQGISKDEQGHITIIPKTLPNETVKARIVKKKGAVSFGKLIEVVTPAENRIKSECVIFHKCNGCSYWHTDIQSEHGFKQENFKRNLRSLERSIPTFNIESQKVEYLSSKQRSHYRNRIQLHYDRRQKAMGFQDRQGNIIAVNQCVIATQKINLFLQEITSENKWTQFLRSSDPDKGHFEIIDTADQANVQLHINQDYSFGGFNQVNNASNTIMVNKTTELAQGLIDYLLANASELKKPSIKVLDLFGGSGNLSRELEHCETLVVDSHQPKEKLATHQQFLKQDLYHPHAPRIFHEKTLTLNNQTRENLPTKADSESIFDILILDPPRSGVKNLKQFIDIIKPRYIIYISCQYNSQIRDINSCAESIESIQEVYLFDLFPTTHHVETMITIKTRY